MSSRKRAALLAMPAHLALRPDVSDGGPLGSESATNSGGVLESWPALLAMLTKVAKHHPAPSPPPPETGDGGGGGGGGGGGDGGGDGGGGGSVAHYTMRRIVSSMRASEPDPMLAESTVRAFTQIVSRRVCVFSLSVCVWEEREGRGGLEGDTRPTSEAPPSSSLRCRSPSLWKAVGV